MCSPCSVSPVRPQEPAGRTQGLEGHPPHRAGHRQLELSVPRKSRCTSQTLLPDRGFSPTDNLPVTYAPPLPQQGQHPSPFPHLHGDAELQECPGLVCPLPPAFIQSRCMKLPCAGH